MCSHERDLVMTIKTSTFGGITLTGEDAVAFKKQFLGSKTKFNPRAQKAQQVE